jgi:hypothetical protein
VILLLWHLCDPSKAALVHDGGPSDDAGGSGGVVLGDSYSDEYRFYPPDRTTARNWVEILAEVRGLNFGRLTTKHRGEPRNQGCEFNWARSDATTADLIATGQHAGLAGQVVRGEIAVVVSFIGGNDFINALLSDNPTAVLELVLARASANLRLVLETILKASPSVQVLLATLPNILELPEFALPLRAGRIPASVAREYTEAIRRYNLQIRKTALRHPQVAPLDLALLVQLAPARTPTTSSSPAKFWIKSAEAIRLATCSWGIPGTSAHWFKG